MVFNPVNQLTLGSAPRAVPVYGWHDDDNDEEDDDDDDEKGLKGWGKMYCHNQEKSGSFKFWTAMTL
jgi:hypothetical protein